MSYHRIDPTVDVDSFNTSAMTEEEREMMLRCLTMVAEMVMEITDPLMTNLPPGAATKKVTNEYAYRAGVSNTLVSLMANIANLIRQVATDPQEAAEWAATLQRMKDRSGVVYTSTKEGE